VQASGSSCNADGFCSINLQFASVPSDKRLVLKQVSVLFTAKTGASVLPVVLAGGATKVLGNPGLFPFTEMRVPISRAAGPIVFGAFCTAAAPCDEWLVHQQVEYYIEPGSAPIVVPSADQSHLVPIFTEATVTGYYVPAS